MAKFQLNGEEYYIDERLARDLDKKIVPDLSKKDEDAVFLIDGRERSGKSTFGMLIGGYIASKLGTRYDISNICLNPLEFRNRILSAQKNEVVIYDEAHRGMGSSRTLSEINNILKDLMMEMGQKNLFVLIIQPTFFLLDKYAALFRSRGLFHIYKRKRRKGFWCFFNEKNKMRLYMKGKKEFNYNCIKWPNYRGRFTSKYTINEAQYRDKKARSFKEVKRDTKNEHFLIQRNMLLWALHKELDLNPTNMAKLMKLYDIGLKRTTISDILKKIAREKGEIEKKSADSASNPEK